MDTEQTLKAISDFHREKGWGDYHTLISLSRALGIEASEVEKVFLWKNKDSDLSSKEREELKLEIADVLIYAYTMCLKMKLDPNDIVMEKLDINKTRHWSFEESTDEENRQQKK